MAKTIKVGDKLCISTKALYERFGVRLAYTEVKLTQENGIDYYALINKGHLLACMDGEPCVVSFINTRTNTVQFVNEDSKIPFTLTFDEVSVAVFK